MRINGRVEVPDEAIAEFCHKWKITEVAVFGSVLREDFGPESDIDVLVTFEAGTHWTLFDLGHMETELAAVFRRKVDLVERKGVEENPNYLRRRRILDSSETVLSDDEARFLLLDMLMSGRAAVERTEDVTWERFAQDAELQDAVIRPI